MAAQPSQLTQIKLVVSDLDGTLLGHDHQPGEVNQRAIEACKALGIDFMLASGRLAVSVLDYARALDLPGEHICGNGSYTARASDGSFHHLQYLMDPALSRCIEVLKHHHLQAMLFGADTIYTDCQSPELEYLLSFGEPGATLVPNLASGQHTSKILKVLVVLEAGPLDQELEAAMGKGIHMIRTGKRFLEFMSPGVSKGATLARIMAERGLQADEVMALGDNDNDVSMFQAVGYSFAMEGATPAAKAAASHHTAAFHEHGVALALEKIIKAHRGTAS